MKPEQQRIAIAEACGYSRQEPDSVWFDSPHDGQIYIEDLPDYLNDLNAMREARKILTAAQKGEYARILKALTWQSDQPEYCAMDATAEQEAEAFLKTLKLWNE